MSSVVKNLAVKRAGSLDAPESVKAQNFKLKCVGWFTRNSEGDFCGEDASQLKFLHLPSNLNNVNFDLSKRHAEDKFNLPIQIDENIDPMLHWIKDTLGKRPSAGFVGSRNAFARILKVPYERNEDLLIHAVKIRDIIYLCEFLSENKKLYDLHVDANMNNRAKEGLRFQKFLLSEKTGEAPDMDGPLIHDKREVCVVLEGKVGAHNVLYTSENLGLPTEESMLNLDSAPFFYLRTARYPDFNWCQLVTWWSMSLVGKFEQTIVGIKGDDAHVRSIRVLNKDTLLQKAQVAYNSRMSRNRSSNMENRCISFMDEFLSHVREVMIDVNSPTEVFRFEWSGKNDKWVKCSKVTGDDSEGYRFLPKWYLDWLDSCTEQQD